MRLAGEIERLVGVINANIKRRINAEGAKRKAGTDMETCLQAIFDDESRAISTLADQAEERGEVLMADLLRGVRDDQMPHLLQKYRLRLRV